MDISSMTVDQLEKHISDAQKLLEKKKAKQVEELKKKVADYAKELGTSVDELFGPKG